MFVEEVDGGHGGDHLCETGNLPNFMNALTVVVHESAILPLPDAPALG